jgi:bifunctional DNA-binding transcriptional regulator/antitoxin component of YhaV-PrlF toxin-antitoxin module
MLRCEAANHPIVCGNFYIGGMETVRVDGEGRVTIPRRLRAGAGVRAGGYVRVRGVGRAIVIEPVESVADKYYGAFSKKWPDLGLHGEGFEELTAP